MSAAFFVTGTDTDVGSSPIGFARSGSSLVTSTVNAGADGEASRAYALNVTDGTFSGVSTTEGTQVFLLYFRIIHNRLNHRV